MDEAEAEKLTSKKFSPAAVVVNQNVSRRKYPKKLKVPILYSTKIFLLLILNVVFMSQIVRRPVRNILQF